MGRYKNTEGPRRCASVPISRKVEAVDEWRREGWGSKEAAAKLGVNKGTLLGWRREYDKYKGATHARDTRRLPGAGRKPTRASAEGLSHSVVVEVAKTIEDVVSMTVRDMVNEVVAELTNEDWVASTYDPSVQVTDATETGTRKSRSSNSESGTTLDAAPAPTSSDNTTAGIQKNVTSPAKARRPRRNRVSDVICTYTYINEENHHDGDEKKCHLSKRDLKTLDNYAWIGDVVMTYYLKRYLPKHPSLYVFSSQIFSTLEDQQKQLDVGPCPFYGAITSKFDWLRYRFVFFPIFGSSHWSLAVVEHPIPLPNDPAPTSTVIYHIDSIPNYHRTDHIVDVLMNHFSHESMKKHKARHPDIRSVKKVIPVPRQENSYDCGVHLMHYAQRIAAFIQSNNMDAVNLKDSVQNLVNGCTAAICTETRRSIRTLINNSPHGFENASNLGLSNTI